MNDVLRVRGIGDDPVSMMMPGMQQQQQASLLPLDPKAAAAMAASQLVPGGGIAVQLLSSPEGRRLLRSLKRRFW